MPRFDTPQPISIAVELGVGDIRIVAAARADTVVEVQPSDPDRKADVTAAEQTTVDHANGRLLVKGPKGRRQLGFRGAGGSIAVEIALPAGSQLQAEAGVADLHCAGALGACRVKVGVGAVEIDQAGPFHCKVGAGDVTVQEAGAHTEIATGSGTIRIGRIDGTAVVRHANGATWIGTATGDLRVQAANGRIQVDRAQATAAVKTANGAIRLGEVGPGSVVAETGRGPVEIGIREGVAAWLDLDTRFGAVHNHLGPAERPGLDEPTVEVRATSSFGDITIRPADRPRRGPAIADGVKDSASYGGPDSSQIAVLPS